MLQVQCSATSSPTPCASFTLSSTWRLNSRYFSCSPFSSLPPLNFLSPFPLIQNAELNVADSACNSRSNFVVSAGSPRKFTFSVSGLQVGQPKHFLFSKTGSGSFSVRATAIVDGTSAVAITVADPQPLFPLLSEQRALATYFDAVRVPCHLELAFGDCLCRFRLLMQLVSEASPLR